MKLAAILKNKPVALISVAPETTISDVIALLAEKRIGAVLVIDAAGDLRGILSERDIVRALANDPTGTFTATAATLMTPSPTTVSPTESVENAMEVMTNGRFRHLPVVEFGRLVGLVSIGDVVKAMIDQQKMEVDSLRAYVVGAT